MTLWSLVGSGRGRESTRTRDRGPVPAYRHPHSSPFSHSPSRPLNLESTTRVHPSPLPDVKVLGTLPSADHWVPLPEAVISLCTGVGTRWAEPVLRLEEVGKAEHLCSRS